MAFYVKMNQIRPKWEFESDPELKITQEIAASLSLPPGIVKILINRGLTTPEQAKRFIYPDLSNLLDPLLLGEMDKAVDRILYALKDNQRIMIFGDYDVDGITATSLVFLVLNRLGATVSYYLPNRLKEGYGLSEEGILVAEKRGVKLLISVDCGVTAVKEVEFANQRGIDCIITDHHEFSDILPPAVAIVNPKQKGKNYPGGELSGVGVAFKLAQALYRRLDQNEAELEEHLDLVALGTAADIVPMINENRILTKFGINQIVRTTKPGLKSLIFISGLMGKDIGTGQVVFILAPRINAVGRLGDAVKAIKLLTTKDEQLGSQLARELNQENIRRKKIDETTLDEALEMIEQEVDLNQDKAIVLASSGWHQGVIGIVASRLVERYHRPTILIAVDKNEGKGSARSIFGFDMYDALKECSNFLSKFGGHKYAAGLSIDPKNINKFREKFRAISKIGLKQEKLVPKLTIDSELEFDSIDDKLVDMLNLFAPFGPQNLHPVFLTRNLEILGEPYVVGYNHLKIKVKKNNRIFDAIGFGFGDWVKPLSMKRIKIDLVYVIERNTWNGNSKLQLRIKDLRIVEI
ncbi:MAG: single-stranded-DNA-specific exonuclease RecJ [Candidatus Zixiibacteriota bacterium]